MYNLHLENKKTKKKQKKNNLITTKWQTAFVHHEKVYNLQMKTSTKTLYRPQFGFSASRKTKNRKTLFLTTKSKTMTSKKKGKQRNPLKRAVIKKA